MPMACPHCRADNATGLDFCQTCGKALPSAFLSTPSITTGTLFATTPVGRKLQGYELHSKAKQAAVILGVIAFLTLIGTFVDMSQLPPGASSTTRNVVMMIDFGILACFVGLSAWATKQPLPAAIVGLVLYLGIHILIGVLNPETIPKGIILKIFIVIALAKAIQAGSARQKLESMG